MGNFSHSNHNSTLNRNLLALDRSWGLWAVVVVHTSDLMTVSHCIGYCSFAEKFDIRKDKEGSFYSTQQWRLKCRVVYKQLMQGRQQEAILETKGSLGFIHVLGFLGAGAPAPFYLVLQIKKWQGWRLKTELADYEVICCFWRTFGKKNHNHKMGHYLTQDK